MMGDAELARRLDGLLGLLRDVEAAQKRSMARMAESMERAERMLAADDGTREML